MQRKTIKWIIIALGCLSFAACAKSSSKEGSNESSKASSKESEQQQASAKNATEIAIIPEMNPDYQKAALINVELGLGYLGQGQVARAKTKLMHAVKLAPNISETHSALAYFMEMVGDYKSAEQEHKKAVHYSSGKGAVYNNYGAFLCRRERYKEADQAFHYAIEDKEYVRTAEVYENAGICALKWKDKTAAELKASEYLTTAIRRDPTRTSAVLELAALNLKQGKASEAKDLLGRYKSVAEPSARSLWIGIQVAKLLNDEASVSNQALQLKSLFEDSPEYQMYLKSEKKRT